MVKKNLMGSLNQAQIDTMLSKNYPDIVQIMKRVRLDKSIKDCDKKMIEQQLINLCGALYYTEKYELRLGTWTKGSVYSEKRQQVSDGPTIYNETIFTVVSSGKRSKWVVYIDLPIVV